MNNIDEVRWGEWECGWGWREGGRGIFGDIVSYLKDWEYEGIDRVNNIDIEIWCGWECGWGWREGGEGIFRVIMSYCIDWE